MLRELWQGCAAFVTCQKNDYSSKDFPMSNLEDRLAILVDDPDFRKIDKQFRRFNIFEAIGAIRGELKHSNFLSFILSPARSHGLGSEFRRLDS
jgi:hypothetical protein